ncbi:MAG: hypothetical protein WA584_19525 [Pyrinomonadaceae bacterium]
MSNRKNYNSIVFLTTLSVYLGLVLVGGAAAPVLAHSALTRDFDIKNEIEFKDDLDNKPDNEEIDGFFEIDLDTAVASFIEDLRGLKQKGKYKSRFKKTFTTKCAHTYCSNGDAAASTIIEDEGEISQALWKLHYKLDFIDGRDLSKNSFFDLPKENSGCKEISLNLTFSQNELKIAFSFTKETTQTAFAYAENLNSKFKNKSDESSDLLIKKVYENTNANSENNQVFVVTRLPRASIDEFLANKVAK